MATIKKSKAASGKSSRSTVKTAATKTAAKLQPKKAASALRPSPKKASPAPIKSLKKPTAAAAPKKASKPATPPKAVVKKIVPPVKAPTKDLSKKPVKTAITPKPVAKAPAEPKKPRFSKVDLDQFKVDLLAMRDRITGRSGSMRNDALQRTDEINPEEDGTDAFMRLQTLEQVSSQQQIIANIDEALRAIDKGTYGVCDNCGELINKPRLAVLPFAKNCIKCQSEMERANRPGGRR